MADLCMLVVEHVAGKVSFQPLPVPSEWVGRFARHMSPSRDGNILSNSFLSSCYIW